MIRAIKYWGIFSGLVVSFAVFALLIFVVIKAVPEISLSVFFGDTPPFEAIFKGALVWEGLWNPLYGTIRLMLVTGILSVPIGLALGIYASEYAGVRTERYILI